MNNFHGLISISCILMCGLPSVAGELNPAESVSLPTSWNGTYTGIHPGQVLVNEDGSTTILQGNHIEVNPIRYDYIIQDGYIKVLEEELDGDGDITTYRSTEIDRSTDEAGQMVLRISLKSETAIAGYFSTPTHTLRSIDRNQFEVVTWDNPGAARFIVFRKGSQTATDPGSAYDIRSSTPVSEIPPAAAISTSSNFLYRTIWNDIELLSNHEEIASIEIAGIRGGDWRKTPTGYQIFPTGQNHVEIKVAANMVYGSRWILPYTQIETRRIPSPAPRFGGKGPNDRTITRVSLENAPSVGAIMEDFDTEIVFQIKRFSILAVNSNGSTTQRTSNSNMVTGEMKTLFRSLGRGSTVYFEDIIVSMPDGTERLLPIMKFRVI